MTRIKPNGRAMKIEHWRCREHYPGEQLVYRNLLGACMGGEGRPFRFQHCDTRKADRDLLWNPAELTHMIEAKVQYGDDGAIKSKDETFDSQLNEALNLNLAILRENRKMVLGAVLEWWKNEKGKLQGPVPREKFERMRNKFAATHGDLTPYCQVAVWWLNRRLARVP